MRSGACARAARDTKTTPPALSSARRETAPWRAGRSHSGIIERAHGTPPHSITSSARAGDRSLRRRAHLRLRRAADQGGPRGAVEIARPRAVEAARVLLGDLRADIARHRLVVARGPERSLVVVRIAPRYRAA